MNIDQISELLGLLREINERLARIEGIVQNAAMSSAASASPRYAWPPKPTRLGEIPPDTVDHILGIGAPPRRDEQE